MAPLSSSDDDTPAKKMTAGNVFLLAARRSVRDVLRCADCCLESFECGFHVITRIIGPVLALVATALIGFGTYVFFMYGISDMQEEEGGFVAQLCIGACGVFLLANALYNYLMAMFLDPGTAPEWEEASPSLALEEPSEEVAELPVQCRKCGRRKPPRSHHCSVCRRCILRMDHHCPWVNNCVGHKNYRNFCLFMLYLGSCCCYVLLVFSLRFGDLIFAFSTARRRTRSWAEWQAVTMIFMICLSVLLALCMLGGFHVYLVLTNQTTIEFQSGLSRRRTGRKDGAYLRNPYDLGRSRNFQQVFGPVRFCSFLWLFPWAVGPLQSDGLSYPSLSHVAI